MLTDILIGVAAYLWFYGFALGLAMADNLPHRRTGFDLIWRTAFGPILMPIVMISQALTGRKQ